MNLRFFLILLSISVSLILILIAWGGFRYYQVIHADDPIDPSFSLEKGEGKIIRGDLSIRLSSGETYNLKTKDIIETAQESVGIVNWPDRSITRLGSNTRIVIEKMQVSDSYDSIQISYEIKRGKVWNHVIRLLLGDSYFEARLPKDNIIAGVRGTTFEIHLDNGYIHSVEHAIRLSDKSGTGIDLLPGELVSSENIWTKLGRDILDITWNEWNTLSDKAINQIRALELEKRFNILKGEGLSYLSLGGLTEKALSYVSGFEALEISKYLDASNREELGKYSKETLIEYYQKISGISFVENRDQIRRAIIEKIDTNESYKTLKMLLENASVWESIDTGKILPGAKNILDKHLQNLNTLKDTEGAQMLIQSLSGNLQNIIQSIPSISREKESQ